MICQDIFDILNLFFLWEKKSIKIANQNIFKYDLTVLGGVFVWVKKQGKCELYIVCRV